MLSHYANFFLPSNLIQQISQTAIWLYEKYPLFSAITGLHHPGVSHLKGNIFLGRAGYAAANEGLGLGDELKKMGEIAAHDARGMCYGSYANMPFLYVTRPSDIQQILVDHHDDIDRNPILEAFSHIFGHKSILSLPVGPEWETKRRALRRWIFSGEALDNLVEPMTEVIDEYIAKLAKEKKIASLEHFMVQFAMDIFSRSVLKTDSIAESASEISSEISRVMHAATNPYNLMLLKLKKIAEYVLIKTKIPLDDNKKNLEEVLTNLFIRPNIENLKNKPNYLQHYFTETHDEEKIKTQIQHALDDVGFTILAGHETTSRLLQFTIMLLTQHPEVLAKLRQEIAQYTPENGQWDREALMHLHYLKKILKECLRLFPPAPVIARMASKDFTLMNFKTPHQTRAEAIQFQDQRNTWEDIIIRKGTVILIGSLQTHHSELLYEHPFEFNPDRFTSDTFSSFNEEPRYQFAFIPFSVGPRDCIGRHLALQEAMLALIHLTTTFDFEIQAQNKEIPLFETYMLGTLKLKGLVETEFLERSRLS